jgi:hypothetical protein
MKKILMLILTLVPMLLLGQHLKCCQSKKEVATYLSGKWTLKNTDSEIIYQYWIEKGLVNLTEMKRTEKEGEYIILDNHPFVEIIKYDQGFKLKFIDLYTNWIYELKQLTANTMILVTDGKEIEYRKVSE